MKKRIFAGLLTLVMVFTLLPVSAMAEAGNWEQNLFNGFNSAYGTLVGTKSFTATTTFQTDKDGQLKVMPILEVPSGYTTITYNAMAYCGAKAASNNTDVVEVKQTDDGKQDICIGKWEGGDFHGADCLQVNVTPKKAGSAIVTISFYYTFSQSVNPFQNGRNTRWFKGTMRYTVKVTEPEPDPEVEYTLNYDANGGENAPTSQTAKSSTGSATFTIPEKTPTRDNYDFKGWADSATATEAQYQPGGNIAVKHTDSPKTVYAVWEKDDSPTPDKPVSPSYDDLKSVIGKIQVKDVSKPDCGTEIYDLIDNTQSEPFNWTKTARQDQPGTYDVSIKTAPYVAKYNSEKAKAHELNDAGQTTLNLVISYKDKKWVLDGGKAEIEVKHTESTPTETPPNAPTADELKKLEMAVQVKCVVDDSQRHNDAYDLLGECDVDYFVGKPRKDGDDWLCDISYDPDLYVAKFNTTFQNLKHVQNDEKIVPVTLIWAGGSWQIKTQGRVHVTEEYTVTFNAYGGFPTPDEQHVKSGEKAVLPVAPTLKGYTFAFWYLGEDEQNATAYDFGTPVTENITLTAKWNINKYTVTFDTDGGTPVPPNQEVEYGLTATEPTTAPTKTGYTFDGWYLGDEKYGFSDAVEQNITLKAKWEAIPYGVTYSYHNSVPAEVMDTLPTDKGTYTVKDQVPVQIPTAKEVAVDGYKWTFKGWQLDGKDVKSEKVNMTVGGLHFEGIWEREALPAAEYPVTYEYVSGTEGAALPWNVIASLPVNENTYTIGQQVTTAMKPDDVVFGEYTWKFQGWTLDGTAVAPNTQVPMVKDGLHFVGTWIRTSAQDEEYPVTYEYVSGTEGAALPWNVIASLPVNENTYTIGQQVPTAMKPDDVVFGEYTWKFQGWTLDGTAVAPNTQVPMVKGGLKFVGTWIRTSAQDEEYPVTYSYVSGVEGVELPEEVKATLPVNENTYTIGQQVPTAAKPADVTVGDYIWSLKAWKLGDNEIVPNNSIPMVEGGLNFVGIWTREKATVTVTFNANGGTVDPTSETITKGSTLTLPTPTRSGYRFDGWFTEKTGGTQVKANETTFDKDTTIYAHWTKKSSGGGSSSRDYDYTLRYVTNGGKSIASETKSKSWTKDYEDLPMPTRAGYRFDGWYYDSALKNEVTGDVKINSRTVTLYAGWTGSSVPDSLNGEDHFAYVQGYADGTVRPNTPVTRAQVATILFRLLDESVRKEYLTENNTFTDVAPNYWANTAISTMANMGVFKGRTADRFDPNAPITRGEFAAVCARFDDSKVKTTETYSDINGYWAANEILRAAALGWVQGYQDGSYRPNNSITRAQVVTMINRVLCRMPEENADLLKGMSSFTDCAEDDWCYLAIQEATNSHGYKTKSGSIHEKWTDLNAAPDWSRFEH